MAGLEKGAYGYIVPTIYSVPETNLEIIQPDRLPSAFECEYCGTAYVADLVSRELDCPGCGHPPPYAQLQAALSPPLFSEMDPVEYEGMVSGSVVDLRYYGIRDAMITGSVQAYASWQGPNNLVARCRMDGKAPAVGDSGLCRVHGGYSLMVNTEIERE